MEALDPARFEPLVGPERMARFEAVAEETRERLAGRAVVNVNSTAVGGGVAEMLQTLLAYARGAGVDARWLVIRGDPEFFAVTKRIHNGLYGGPGDGGPLGRDERAHYETVSARTPGAARLPPPRARPAARSRRRRDGARQHGARVGSSSGAATSGSTSRTSGASAPGSSCAPTSTDVDGYVFSRAAFAPPWADPARTFVDPALDRPVLGEERADVGAERPPRARLRRARGGRRATRRSCRSRAVTGRAGGSPAASDVMQLGPAPPADAPLVLQASRWDAHEGHGRRHGGVRPPRRSRARGAPRPRRPGRDRRRRRSRGGRRLRRLHRPLARAAARGAEPRPPGLHADGRPGRGRGDRERAPAPRQPSSSRRASPRASG